VPKSSTGIARLWPFNRATNIIANKRFGSCFYLTEMGGVMRALARHNRCENQACRVFGAVEYVLKRMPCFSRKAMRRYAAVVDEI
jgi:hypothetical protein